MFDITGYILSLVLVYFCFWSDDVKDWIIDILNRKYSKNKLKANKEELKQCSNITFEFNSINKAILSNNEIIAVSTGWKFIHSDKQNDSRCVFYKDGQYITILEVARSDYQIIDYKKN